MTALWALCFAFFTGAALMTDIEPPLAANCSGVLAFPSVCFEHLQQSLYRQLIVLLPASCAFTMRKMACFLVAIALCAATAPPRISLELSSLTEASKHLTGNRSHTKSGADYAEACRARGEVMSLVIRSTRFAC
jgi:hypothetical protein